MPNAQCPMTGQEAAALVNAFDHEADITGVTAKGFRVWRMFGFLFHEKFPVYNLYVYAQCWDVLRGLEL
jgi:hypothetical protein